MRLIDADALEKAIYEWMPKDQSTWMDSDLPPIENLVVSLMMTIQEQPTVDAVPVRHGKWIWKGKDGDSRFMCSECKSKEHVPTCMGVPNIWEYCPNCGARMDKDETD